MSSSSSSEKHGKKPPRAPTEYATWSLKGTPSDNDELKDAYKTYQKLRDNYEHIGDAYGRSQHTADEWEIKDPGSRRMPYLAHIKSLTPTWRTLRFLSDWMEVGTTPLRWKELKDTPEHTRRMNKTLVTCMEYRSAAASAPQTLDTPVALEEFLYSLPHEQQTKPPLRIFYVEDLSQQVIEILGARFDMDPMCFRDHIDDYVWHNVRDPWAQPPSLLSGMKHRQWFHVRNIRARYHETQADFDDAWKETNTWNVLRRPENDKNRWKFADSSEAIVSMMRTRTTWWIGKDKECDNGIVAVVLLDPTPSQGQPLWYDRTNWLPVPKMHDAPKIVAKQSESWYKDMINNTKTFPWFEPTRNGEIDPQVIAKPALYTICAEWLVICDYAKARLSQIERELEMPRLFRSKGDAIDTSLKRLHTWRRQIPIFREMVQETLDDALPAAARLAAAPPPSPGFPAPSSPMSVVTNQTTRTDFSVISFNDRTGYQDIVPDFLRVLAAIDVLQQRVDRLTDIVTSEMGIEDSRRGLKENHNMARLTWLATIFIPLSFVSSFYSMNEDISELSTTYGWFFLTAVPFTLVVMAVGWRVGRDSWWGDGENPQGVFGGKDVKVQQEPGTNDGQTEWWRKSLNIAI